MRLVVPLLACLLGVVFIATTAKGLVDVPEDTTWALIAWGFDGGGQDVLQGQKVVDVDLFDQADQIAELKDAGHIVICYFSAGSWESCAPTRMTRLGTRLK